MEILEDAWEAIVDALVYVFTFEWLGDLWEFLGGMFENLGEFSVMGLIFGLIGFGVVYGLREYMLNPFLVHFSPIAAIIWGGATYLGSFMGGYLLGKAFENAG